ncbi:energy transducer TonB [Erythrobacter sp. R86502]|uniref:energy transducer TonB n=1 Tax=Erythrobacter sp. R86502 TaxID=3093846 RepID=UPI0036D2864F
MRNVIFAVAAIGSALAHVPASAEQVVLQPASRWNVDFAQNKCRLVRLFGDGKDQHLLSLEQYWPTIEAGLTVAGPSVRRFRSAEDVDISFYNGQQPQERSALMGTIKGIGDAVVISSVRLDGRRPDDDAPNGPVGPDAMVAMGQQANILTVRQKSRAVSFATGPMDDAFRVMNRCTLDLLREWGLEPERHLTAMSRPVWNNKDALSAKIAAVYPRSASYSGLQAILRMRVIVGADGKVESCDMIDATESEGLKSPACQIMENATFEPARDASGAPFRSFYATSIIYRMG